MSNVSINRVVLSGNLTRDGELRSTTGGTTVLTFGIAVNDRRRNASGEWEDVPNFVDCVMFGTRAEALSRFLTKGTKVALEGKLRYSSWERDGQRRSKLEVIVDDLEFMSSRNGQGSYQGGAQQARSQQASEPAFSAPSAYQPQQQAPQRPVQAPPSADVYDEDIPF